MNARAPAQLLIVTFLAMLAAPPLVQGVVEVSRGQWPGAWQIFSERPSAEGWRAFEKSLEAASVTVRVLRPWMRVAQFFALQEAGEKALVGRDGWLFYQPGVSFLTQRPRPREATLREALAATIDFRDALAARGIRLLLVPAPNKESIYPEKLTRRAASPDRVLGAETRAFFARCAEAGVETVNLFALFQNSRAVSDRALYLAQDSHWSPAGMEAAASAVADRLRALGWIAPGSVTFDLQAAPVQRLGDLIRMARSRPLEDRIVPETVAAEQVVRRDTGVRYADDAASEVLVLGDSFLRIYQQDEPGQAGFVAHLARALGRPLASIINDGGASTLVRQELCRRPQLLVHAKVVVWEFVERDLRLGTEGWQRVPLPPQRTVPAGGRSD